MNFNPLPEEQQHPDLVRDLQAVYLMTSEDRASLDRIQTRLFQLAPGQPQEQEPAHRFNGNIALGNPGRPRRNKPWFQHLGLIAAAFFVVVLTGVLLSTFVLMREKINNRSLPVTSGQSTSISPVQRTLIGKGQSLESKGFCMIDSQNGWAISSQNSGPLFRTTDGGKSWQRLNLPQKIVGESFSVSVFDKDMAFLLPKTNPAGFLMLYFYRTIDGGTTWQRINWPTTPKVAQEGFGEFDWTFLDHNHGWVSVMTQQYNGAGIPGASQTDDETLYHTDNGGLAWQKVARFPFKYRADNLTFSDAQTGWLTTHIDDPNHAALSDPYSFPAALYMTHDGGYTWKQSLLPAPPTKYIKFTGLQGPWFRSANTGYLLAAVSNISGNGDKIYLYITRDNGKSWQVSGAAFTTYGLNVLDATHSYDNTFLYVLINGQWVKTSNAPPGGDTTRVQFLSPQIGIAIVNAHEEVYRSNDGGKTWQGVGHLGI